MAVNVISPGLSTTVQDLGRPGYYHLGIPISGGMDRFALRAANMLVGNDEGAAVLEAVFLGPELEFTAAATVAVTGGDLPPRLNGDERSGWEAFPVKAGDRLTFGYLKSGARAYIAVSGGIDVPVKLGSRSTYTLGALGGAMAAPTTSMVPGAGADMIVLSFAVVATAGMGQISGALLASLMIGLARSMAVYLAPEWEVAVPYLIMVLVLLVRPNGLFSVAQARRI